MKKRVLAFSILILLLFSILFISINTNSCFAQDIDLEDENDTTLEDLKKIGDIKNVKGKTEELLAKQVQIPEKLQIFARIIFGLKSDEEIDLQHLIVLIAIWIMLLMFIEAILKFMPFFEEGAKTWITAAAITCLIAITGVTKTISTFFFNLGNIFGILEKWGPLRLAFAIIIAFAIFYVTSYVLKIFREKYELQRAKQEGVEAAQGAAFLKTTAKEIKE